MGAPDEGRRRAKTDRDTKLGTRNVFHIHEAGQDLILAPHSVRSYKELWEIVQIERVAVIVSLEVFMA